MTGICNGDVERGILTIIFCILGALLILLVLSMTRIFVKHVIHISKSGGVASKRNKQSKLVIYSKSFLFSTIIFSMIMYIVFMANLCSSHPNPIYNGIANFTYMLQAFMMVGAWFIRLYVAFTGTVLQIHDATMFIFLSITISLFIFATIFGFDPVFIHHSLIGPNWYIVAAMLGTVLILLILFLCGLFIYKLVMVYKKLGSDDELIKVITRITILNFTFIFVTISYGVTLVTIYEASIYGEFISEFALLLNYFSNFVCIILSYTYFDKTYNRCCGWMNTKCNACWYKLITGEDIEEKLARLRSRSDISRIASNTATSVDIITRSGDATTPNTDTKESCDIQSCEEEEIGDEIIDTQTKDNSVEEAVEHRIDTEVVESDGCEHEISMEKRNKDEVIVSGMDEETVVNNNVQSFHEIVESTRL